MIANLVIAVGVLAAEPQINTAEITSRYCPTISAEKGPIIEAGNSSAFIDTDPVQVASTTITEFWRSFGLFYDSARPIDSKYWRIRDFHGALLLGMLRYSAKQKYSKKGFVRCTSVLIDDPSADSPIQLTNNCIEDRERTNAVYQNAITPLDIYDVNGSTAPLFIPTSPLALS